MEINKGQFRLSSKTKNFKFVKFGNNVLIGKDVKIGKKTVIGSNTIIESKVEIGDNCVIGSGCIIKNSIIGKSVMIQDNCKIGQKGFGFIPVKNKNIKFPHIGNVLIEDDVEIAKSYHRYSFNPGDNVSDQTTRIQNVCATVWTQDVIDTYVATQAAQDPSVDPNP